MLKQFKNNRRHGIRRKRHDITLQVIFLLDFDIHAVTGEGLLHIERATLGYHTTYGDSAQHQNEIGVDFIEKLLLRPAERAVAVTKE